MYIALRKKEKNSRLYHEHAVAAHTPNSRFLAHSLFKVLHAPTNSPRRVHPQSAPQIPKASTKGHHRVRY